MVLAPNKLLAAVRSGRTPIGMQSFSGSPVLLEAMGASGFDFVMIDKEHTPLSGAELSNLIRAAEVSGIEPYVRVAENTEKEIRWALDLGARGVFLPAINTAEEMRAALDAALHPPYGHRGSCPATRIAGLSTAGYGAYAEWVRDNVLAIPLLETPTAIANARAICAVDGVKVVCFGAGDYGQAVGAGVGAGMTSPRVVEGFEAVLQAALEFGVHMIGFPYPHPTLEAAERIIEKGADILILSADSLIFRDRCAQLHATLAPALSARTRRAKTEEPASP